MAKLRKKTPEELEDMILWKIFQVTLINSRETHPSMIYLQSTAAEILSERKSLSLSVDLLERILIDRLRLNLVTVEPVFQYLINCYRRATDEGKKIAAMKDKTLWSGMELVVDQAKKFIVSYSRIHVGNPGVFFDSNAKEYNVSPLLPLIFSKVSVDGFGGSDSRKELMCPSGFLEDFFGDGDYYSLEPIMKRLYEDLRDSVVKVSALGDFQKPLKALLLLVSYPVGAKALVNHPCWITKCSNGRVIEMESILGPFFHVSALPDHHNFKSEPDVGQQCFPEPSALHPTDLLSPFTTIRIVMSSLHDGLAEVLLCLLKNTSTHKNVLEYLSEVINKNASRAHIRVDPLSCASSGMFLNLTVVMLQLCDPFLDANLTKRDKIDPKYIVNNDHLNLRDLTALHASSKEVSEWISENYLGRADAIREKINGHDQLLPSKDARSYGFYIEDPSLHPRSKPVLSCASKPEYHFICECFFMTARVLHLGLLKAFMDYECLVQDISRCREYLSTMEAIHAQDPSSYSEKGIVRIEEEIRLLSQEKLCYEVLILRDEELIQRALSFYRLMVVWLVGLVGGVKMPLPSSCPMDFAVIPEHFVEDAMNLLIYSTTWVPRALDGALLDDFMNFIIIFMASPQYIRNPYLRVKMVQLCNSWTTQGSGSSATAALFEGHQLALKHLVRNLLKFYVDIEFIGSDSQLHDKFNTRHFIAKLLDHLWKIPRHRNVWKQIAKEEEKGVYLNFLNFLINDSIFLLDESFNKIIELKELEVEMSDKAKWEQRPAQERQERTRQFHSHETIIQVDMKLANENVSMLTFTSEQIRTPFLLPEMVERVASMLNYFLLQLLGPQRKSLRLKDPEKYEFRPRQLLKQIVRIYVQLAQGDEENVIPAAIIKDGRSYNDQLFKAAADVLRRIGEDARIIQEFLNLGAKAKVAASEASDAEAALGDIPDEFLDPIQCTLMRDPVILPSSRKTVDRAVIQRHLLSANTDPFNRSILTMEMLIPDTDLKSKIEDFIRCREFEQHLKI